MSFDNEYFHIAVLKEEGTDLVVLGVGTKSEWEQYKCLPDGYTDAEHDYLTENLFSKTHTAFEEMEGFYAVGVTAEEARAIIADNPAFHENKDLAEEMAACVDWYEEA